MKSKKENRLLNLAGKLAKAEAARAKSASMCRNFASAETSDEKVMQHGK